MLGLPPEKTELNWLSHSVNSPLYYITIIYKMTDYELFEEMTKARDKYDKHADVTYELQKRNWRLIDQCEDVENKFYSSIMNTELNKILNSNMCKTQKKFACYKNMLANDIELQKHKKYMARISSFLLWSTKRP